MSYDVGNYPVSTMFRQECHLQKVGIKMQYLNHATQLPRYVSMLIKLFQVFYYVFLVVPSLDFMLEVKSSQKLTVPSVPFIENVDI